MSLLHHIYERSIWQSDEYSLSDTVCSPPPPFFPFENIWVTPLKKKRKLPSFPRRSRLGQFNDYLGKTESLFHTVLSALIKKNNK